MKPSGIAFSEGDTMATAVILVPGCCAPAAGTRSAHPRRVGHVFLVAALDNCAAKRTAPPVKSAVRGVRTLCGIMGRFEQVAVVFRQLMGANTSTVLVMIVCVVGSLPAR